VLKYRHTTEADLPKIEAWMQLDPAHKDTMKPGDFVLGPDAAGMQCIEVADETGTVFFLKLTNALLVETQFPPDVSQLRIARSLKEAFGYFSVASKNLGYHAMFFRSLSESLVAFFERLGFKKLIDFYKADL
jgi:hypothetical protein